MCVCVPSITHACGVCCANTKTVTAKNKKKAGGRQGGQADGNRRSVAGEKENRLEQQDGTECCAALSSYAFYRMRKSASCMWLKSEEKASVNEHFSSMLCWLSKTFSWAWHLLANLISWLQPPFCCPACASVIHIRKTFCISSQTPFSACEVRKRHVKKAGSPQQPPSTSSNLNPLSCSATLQYTFAGGRHGCCKHPIAFALYIYTNILKT